MLLTEREREFLTAFLHEATTDPFKGPATEELHRRNIYYTDITHLVTAYYQENAGPAEGFGDKHISPPCPWQDWDSAISRDHEVGLVLDRLAAQTV